MIESILRAHAGRLQTIYDLMPHFARNAATSARAFALPRNQHRTQTMRLLGELRGHERWTQSEITAYQQQQLHSIIAHARTTCRFYAHYSDFRPATGLSAYSVLGREVVRSNSNEMMSRLASSRRFISVGTTGTTGAALRVRYEEKAARLTWAFFLRQWLWAGLTPYEPRITFFGSRIVPPQRSEPPFWTYNLRERQILASSFHLSNRTAWAYLSMLKQHSGKILEAFPSILGILADFVLESGKPIPMKAIFTSGEPLYPSLREKAELAFNSRVYDSYGMTELCGLIQECERGRMHLAPEFAFLEILDENDQPVTGDQEGFFVWTGFINRAMPFIRYRIGDRGRWDNSGPCECGRNFPLVVPTITRDSDLLCCPDGRVFSPRTLNQSLKAATALRFCQFIHDEPDHLLIRAVARPGQGVTPQLTEVCSNIRRLLGPQMRVSFALEPEPLMRRGGKIPLIINQRHQIVDRSHA